MRDEGEVMVMVFVPALWVEIRKVVLKVPFVLAVVVVIVWCVPKDMEISS